MSVLPFLKSTNICCGLLITSFNTIIQHRLIILLRRRGYTVSHLSVCVCLFVCLSVTKIWGAFSKQLLIADLKILAHSLFWHAIWKISQQLIIANTCTWNINAFFAEAYRIMGFIVLPIGHQFSVKLFILSINIQTNFHQNFLAIINRRCLKFYHALCLCMLYGGIYFFLLQIRRQLSLKCRVRMSTLFKALIINALNMFKITQNKCWKSIILFSIYFREISILFKHRKKSRG